MFQDLKELLNCFHAHNVKYLIVGGYAVAYHSQPKTTKDLDIFVQADSANAASTYKALLDFGVALGGITPDDLTNPKNFVRFGREPVAVDILTAIDGVKFEDAWPNRGRDRC